MDTSNEPLTTELRALVSQSRIALFLPDLGGGGAERMMVNLAHGCARAGAKVDLVVASGKGPYLELLHSSVELHDLKATGTAASLWSLTRYLKQFQPDVILSTLNRASVIAVLAKLLSRTDTTVFIREANTISRDRPTNLRSGVVRRLVPILYPFADGIIAVSEGVAEDLSGFTGIARQSIETIYNPVVTRDIAWLASEAADHRWLSGDPEEPVILAVGRLAPQKDFATLIRAFSQVRNELNAKLVILGEGPERHSLETLARDLGLHDHVSMPGFVNNPFAYMARATVLVLSSAWEGFPSVIVQALACGCPVVSTDCPSGPAEILENGRWGRLVPVGKAAPLATAVVDTIRAPTNQAKLKERSRAFSVDLIVQEYLKVLFAEES